MDVSQAEVNRQALGPKVFRLHENDEVGPSPAHAPTPQHVVRERRPRQQAVQAVNPPQAAPPTRIIQPVGFEQPVAEVGYPALQPWSPRAALPRERQPFDVRQYAVDAVAPPHATPASTARPPPQIRSPLFRQIQVPQPRPRPMRKSLDEPCYVCYEELMARMTHFGAAEAVVKTSMSNVLSCGDEPSWWWTWQVPILVCWPFPFVESFADQFIKS